jgi:DNA modification methylase
MNDRETSPLNRTIRLDAEDMAAPIPLLAKSDFSSNVYRADVLEALDILPGEYFDLIVADPPYNYGIDFGNDSDKRSDKEYRA